MFFFEEERVIPVVQVVPEVVRRVHFAADVGGNLPAPLHELIQRVGREVLPRLQVDELAERESPQVVHGHDVLQIVVPLDEPHDRRAGKHDVQLREAVITLAQLRRPVFVLERLVDEQRAPAVRIKTPGELHQRMLREVEVVEVHVQATAVVCPERVPGILQEERGLPHPTAAFYADKAMRPVYLVHQQASDRRLHMLHQVSVCPVKRFHLHRHIRKRKISTFFRFCQPGIAISC